MPPGGLPAAGAGRAGGNEVLNPLRGLQEKRGLTYVLISHDLVVVRHIADYVCVMFLGRVCEPGATEAVFGAPAHPYTRFLPGQGDTWRARRPA